VPDFLRVPAVPEPLVLSMADPSMLAETPERLLGLAAHLLLSGDTARGGEYLDLLEQTGRIPPGSELAARLAAFQSFRYGVAGQLETAVQKALAARAAQDLTHLTDEWNVAVPLILARMYTCLGDFPAAEREAAAALAAPDVAESVKLVMVPGKRALALFEAGYLAQAADLAGAADADAQPLGFSWHFFAVDHLRALSGLAGTPRPRCRGASHRTTAVDNRAAEAAPRIPGVARPNRRAGDAAAPLAWRYAIPRRAGQQSARRAPRAAAGRVALAAGANHGVQRNTVKTHLRSIYQKLAVASRSEALERAVDLRLL